MGWQYTPYALPYLITALLLIPMAFLAWQRRHVPGAATLILVMLAVAGWCVATVFELGCPGLDAKLFWSNVEYFGIVTIPPAWWVFSLRYSGYDRWLSRRRILLISVVPAITLALAWTNEAHGLMRQGVFLDTAGDPAIVGKTFGPWFWVWVAYTYALLMLSTLLLGRALARESHLYRGQVVALGFAILVPWIANALHVFRLSPWPRLDPTAVSFAFSGLVWTAALYRYRLMDIVPVAHDAVLESLQDGVVVLDARGRVVDLNPAARRFLGADARQVIGRDGFDVFGPYPGLVERLADAEEIRLELVLGDGLKAHCWDVRISPLPDYRSQVQGRLVVLRDITDLKRAADESQRLEARVQQSQKLESLGVLAGGVAHTFNNILTAILANCDLALMDLPADSRPADRIRRLEVAAQRAADLTRQMLAYSGKGQFVLRPTDLAQLVREMAPLLETAISKKASVQYDLADDAPLVLADGGQMRQLILGLVTNASEALGDQVGAVSVRVGSLDADRSLLAGTFPNDQLPSGRYACLEVTDSGAGMDAETRARIFEPFYSTKFVGRGLGLPAVLGIVRGHEGTIKVESAPGRGSTFLVLLPPSGDARPTVAPDGPTRTWQGKGTVLLVDDEEDVRRVAGDALRAAGLAVLLAGDGEEALRVFQAHRGEIDVVLLDLTMPRMDGVEAMRGIRALDRAIPVLLSSGYAEEDARGRFAEQGLSGFIQKPYRVRALTEAVRRALESRPSDPMA